MLGLHNIALFHYNHFTNRHFEVVFPYDIFQEDNSCIYEIFVQYFNAHFALSWSLEWRQWRIWGVSPWSTGSPHAI